MFSILSIKLYIKKYKIKTLDLRNYALFFQVSNFNKNQNFRRIIMLIRRFKNEDSVELADVIAKTLRTTNIKDYTNEYIENDISFLTAEKCLLRIMREDMK